MAATIEVAAGHYTDFDIAVATSTARLGCPPRPAPAVAFTPNPKTWHVTMDVAKAKEIGGGQVPRRQAYLKTMFASASLYQRLNYAAKLLDERCSLGLPRAATDCARRDDDVGRGIR